MKKVTVLVFIIIVLVLTGCSSGKSNQTGNFADPAPTESETFSMPQNSETVQVTDVSNEKIADDEFHYAYIRSAL